MPATHTIVIYGNTIALGGIALALERHPNWKVIILEEANLAQQLAAHSPDVIIFDQSQTDAQSILTCTERCQDLLAIGVEANSDRMLLWSGHSARALTIQNLTQAIDILPDSIDQPSHRLSLIDRMRQSVGNRMMMLQLTRRQKLAIGIAIIGLCLIGFLGSVQRMKYPRVNAPLIGTAIDSNMTPEIWLAFGVGGVLGGVVIGLFFWFRGHNNGKR